MPRLPVWLPPLASGAALLAIPRHDARELTVSDFDTRFLDRRPVILAGASICPEGATLAGFSRTCGAGETDFEVSVGDGSGWAGFEEGGRRRIDDFVYSMGKEPGAPRYMFDVEVLKICPEVLTSIALPAQLSATFSWQWQGPWSSCSIPDHFNAYLAEAGFQTMFHIDAAHRSFIASMCEGRKLWRVVTNEDFAAQAGKDFPLLKKSMRLDSKLVMADVPQPYDTWGSSEPPEGHPGMGSLGHSEVKVWEGVLEPGEVLYIPSGALHAAKTLDHSLMFAMNDASHRALQELSQACKKAERLYERMPRRSLEEFLEDCEANRHHWADVYPSMMANMRSHGATVQRVSKPFLDAYRCTRATYCEALQRSSGAFNTSFCDLIPAFAEPSVAIKTWSLHQLSWVIAAAASSLAFCWKAPLLCGMCNTQYKGKAT